MYYSTKWARGLARTRHTGNPCHLRPGRGCGG